MNNKNHLCYFLNSMKDELDFNDAEDFKSKVHLKDNLEFRIKIQKFVFLAKYFGWNNTYSYNMYHHGPYSPVLSDDYHSSEVFDNTPLQIEDFNLDSFKKFVPINQLIIWKLHQQYYITKDLNLISQSIMQSMN